MTPDHDNLEDFVRALAKARTYRSSDLGYEDAISIYWKDEAELWVQELDKREKEPRP